MPFARKPAFVIPNICNPADSTQSSQIARTEKAQARGREYNIIRPFVKKRIGAEERKSRGPSEGQNVLLEGDSLREKDVVFEMDMLMEVKLEFFEFLERDPVCRARIIRERVAGCR